jgi:ankyrin repeat protein
MRDIEGTVYVPVMRSDLVELRRMLSAGADPDGPLPECTPLMEVVDDQREFYRETEQAMTDALLDAGADVRRVNTSGRTALHMAVHAGPAAVGRLLAAGADPNHQAADGSTPLHDLAETVGLHPDTMQMLINAGARVDITNDKGQTPLDIAEAEARAFPDPDADRDVDLLRRALGQ